MTVWIVESGSDMEVFSSEEKAKEFMNWYVKVYEMDVVSLHDVFHWYTKEVDPFAH